MSKQIKNIFSKTTCPTAEVMLKYTSNLMEGEEKHVFERHLAECAFCSEAMEGLFLMENKEVREDVFLLNKKIDGLAKPEKRIGYWPLTAAASISLLLLAGTWFYLSNYFGSTLTEGVKIGEILKYETLADSPGVARRDSMVIKNQLSASDLEKEKSVTVNKSQSDQHTWSETPKHMETKESSKRQLSYKQDELKEEETGNYEKINKGYGSGEAMSSAPVSAAPVMANAKPDTIDFLANTKHSSLPEMLSMVEQEFQSPTGPVEQKKLKASRVVASKAEVSKDKSLDDCPNCPKKTASADAESDLMVISMDYALRKYQLKDYKEAHRQFDQIIKENKNASQTAIAKIYDALSLINVNKTEEALRIVDPLISSHPGKIGDAAKWLKASILIDMKENSRAKVILGDLSNYNNYYQGKSKEMLKVIK